MQLAWNWHQNEPQHLRIVLKHFGTNVYLLVWQVDLWCIQTKCVAHFHSFRLHSVNSSQCYDTNIHTCPSFKTRWCKGPVESIKPLANMLCVMCGFAKSCVWRDSLVSSAKTHVALVDRAGYRAVTISDFHWRIIVVKTIHDNIIAIWWMDYLHNVISYVSWNNINISFFENHGICQYWHSSLRPH